MGEAERVLAAYLFLLALEQHQIVCESIDIHLTWVAYCRKHYMSTGPSPAQDLIDAAQQQGFLL